MRIRDLEPQATRGSWAPIKIAIEEDGDWGFRTSIIPVKSLTKHKDVAKKMDRRCTEEDGEGDELITLSVLKKQL